MDETGRKQKQLQKNLNKQKNIVLCRKYIVKHFKNEKKIQSRASLKEKSELMNFIE